MDWSGHRPRVALAAFGRATFDLDRARDVLAASGEALARLPLQPLSASGLLTDPAAAATYARGLEAPDLIVCQFTTFVDARFVAAVAEATDAPLLLWALREGGEPGGRLQLNSLTGANLAASELRRRGRPFRFVLGDPGEDAWAAAVTRQARVGAVARQLAGFTVAVLGAAPDGFTFSEPSVDAAAALGLRLERLDLDALFAAAREVQAADWTPVAEAVRGQVAGLERLDPAQVERFARMQVVVEGEVARRGAAAVAVRCWPEFFTSFGAAACSFVSSLNERGVAASCEADVLGALTMTALGRLAASAPYLGDLAAVDTRRDAAVFWHCGAGAFSLAAGRARAGTHPNRGIGFTLEFALRPGRVTIARLGESAAGLRLLVGGGEALDAPQPFLGTAGTVRLDGPGSVEAKVARLIEDGWEPHYALVHGDVRQELRDLAGLLGLPVTEL